MILRVDEIMRKDDGGREPRGWGQRIFIVAALAVKLLLLFVIFG